MTTFNNQNELIQVLLYANAVYFEGEVFFISGRDLDPDDLGDLEPYVCLICRSDTIENTYSEEIVLVADLLDDPNLVVYSLHETNATGFMEVQDAIAVVLELAADNVLDEWHAKENGLEGERKRQLTAVNTITDFATNHLGDD